MPRSLQRRTRDVNGFSRYGTPTVGSSHRLNVETEHMTHPFIGRNERKKFEIKRKRNNHKFLLKVLNEDIQQPIVGPGIVDFFVAPLPGSYDHKRWFASNNHGWNIPCTWWFSHGCLRRRCLWATVVACRCFLHVYPATVVACIVSVVGALPRSDQWPSATCDLQHTSRINEEQHMTKNRTCSDDGKIRIEIKLWSVKAYLIN